MYKGKTRIRGHRTYRPLTKNEKKEICRRMTRGGVTQAALAIKYGCHPSAIQRTCEAAGIGRWAKLTPKLEARSVALLRAGKAVYRVAKTTRLQGRVIRELMAKHKIEHRRGGGPKLPAAKRAQIALAVRGREDYIYRLAKKFGVNIRTVRAIARQVAGVEKFVGYQPMTPAETDAQIEAGYQEFLETVFHGNFSKELQMQGIHQDFAKLVERFAEIWYDGQIPSDRNSFIATLLEAYMPRVKPGFVNLLSENEYAKERELVAGYLKTAVECVANTNSHWTN